MDDTIQNFDSSAMRVGRRLCLHDGRSLVRVTVGIGLMSEEAFVIEDYSLLIVYSSVCKDGPIIVMYTSLYESA